MKWKMAPQKDCWMKLIFMKLTIKCHFCSYPVVPTSVKLLLLSQAGTLQLILSGTKLFLRIKPELLYSKMIPKKRKREVLQQSDPWSKHSESKGFLTLICWLPIWPYQNKTWRNIPVPEKIKLRTTGLHVHTIYNTLGCSWRIKLKLHYEEKRVDVQSLKFLEYQ